MSSLACGVLIVDHELHDFFGSATLTILYLIQRVEPEIGRAPLVRLAAHFLCFFLKDTHYPNTS